MNHAMIWVNGDIVDRSEPIALAADHGLQLGDGIFDTIAIRDARPVFLERHLRRLRSGLERLEIADTPTDLELGEAIKRLIGSNGLANARVRITITPGPGSGPGSSPLERGSDPLTVITTGTLHAPPSSVSLCTIEWTRNERSPLCGIKSTSWGENAAIIRLARSRGFDNAVLYDSVGRVSECATSNIFAIIDDQVVTPPLDTGCLPGITREVLLERGVASERELLPGDLIDATDVFITSATSGVVPVRRIDELEYPSAGPNMTRIGELVFDLGRTE